MVENRSGSFESLVSRQDVHAALDLDGESRSLLILLGGIAGGVSMPVFEFFRLTAGMPGKRAFLRDPLRGWYQRGIPGIGNSATDIRRYLNGVIEAAEVDRVIMAGASAGGFGALLFGSWCGADQVIAFSPQTFVDEENRRRFGDARWQEQIDDLHSFSDTAPTTLDLLDVLNEAGTKTTFDIHVSADDPLDMIHARRIAGVSRVEVHEHERGGHRLVKTLRDRGVLQPILVKALLGT